MKQKRAAGQLPMGFLLPDVDWKPPTELPDLRGQGDIVVDLETRDDGLAANSGSGWVYNRGQVAGVVLATAQNQCYAPITHPDTANFDQSAVGRWLRDHVHSGARVIFQNAPYDLGWMITEWGIKPPDRIDDTQCMAATVDENRLTYSLDDLCKWQGIPGKDEAALRMAANAYGVDAKAGLHKLPARYVGTYAEQDGRSTYQLAGNLRKQLELEELTTAYQLECDLIPMVVEMRRRGVPINLDHFQRARVKLCAMRDDALAQLSRNAAIGRAVTIKDVASPMFLESLFTQEQVPFPRLKSGRASFESEWMEKRDHWLPQLVARSLKLNGAGEKFIGKYVMDYAYRGRLHAEIHLYRSDDGGTRTTRFSYSDPPLQQMPSRDPDIAELIRCGFLPERGETWGSHDYSQQEFRLIVHFAYVCGMATAERAVEQYRNDPNTDFHDLVAGLTKLPRRKAKDVNFAKAFGAGIPKFALMTGMALEDARETMKQYDHEMPFVSRLSEFCQNRADKRGYIKLLDGARGHWDSWEPRWRDRDKEFEVGKTFKYEACSRAEALERINNPDHPWSGHIKRAFTHKAMNKLIQGSAARQTKMAMRQCWREGIVPCLQMHDELAFSFAREKDGKRVAEIMRDIVKLEVPMIVDAEYGANWGTAKKTKDKSGKVVYDASWKAAQIAVRIANAGKGTVVPKKKKAPAGRARA